MLRAALQHAIVVIAEAVRHLPESLTETHPGVPWSDIVGMGVKVKHQYHHVSGRILWDTVTGDFPNLLLKIRVIIAEQEGVLV